MSRKEQETLGKSDKTGLFTQRGVLESDRKSKLDGQDGTRLQSLLKATQCGLMISEQGNVHNEHSV